MWGVGFVRRAFGQFLRNALARQSLYVQPHSFFFTLTTGDMLDSLKGILHTSRKWSASHETWERIDLRTRIARCAFEHVACKIGATDRHSYFTTCRYLHMSDDLILIATKHLIIVPKQGLKTSCVLVSTSSWLWFSTRLIGRMTNQCQGPLLSGNLILTHSHEQRMLIHADPSQSHHHFC